MSLPKKWTLLAVPVIAAMIGGAVFLRSRDNSGRGGPSVPPPNPIVRSPVQGGPEVRPSTERPEAPSGEKRELVPGKIKGLIDQCIGTAEQDSPGELADALVALGKLLKDPGVQDLVRALLEEHLKADPNGRVSSILALVLSAYDAPASDTIKGALSSSPGRAEGLEGLLVSLTLGRLPKNWSGVQERQFWAEMCLYLPRMLPKYVAKYEEANFPAGSVEELEPGVALPKVKPGSYEHKALDQVTRKHIVDPPLVQAFFDYVVRAGDPDLARRMAFWIKVQDADSVLRILTAYETASSKDLKEALAAYVAKVPVLGSEQIAAWYARETNETVRDRLASEMIASSGTNPVGWFNALYPVESSPEVKSAMIGKLGGVKTVQAIQRLAELADSETPKLQSTALQALANAFGDFAMDQKEPAFMKALASRSPEVRVTALECLYHVAARKYESTFERLSSTDESEIVRNAARQLLTNLRK